MSPTFGGAPPSLGASDLRVDPQALWDVGLALQRVRDAIDAAYRSTADAIVAFGGIEYTNELPEVHDVLTQTARALSDVDVGLARQTFSLLGVLDTAMLSLRTTIDQYRMSEQESQHRLSSIGRTGV